MVFVATSWGTLIGHRRAKGSLIAESHESCSEGSIGNGRAACVDRSQQILDNEQSGSWKRESAGSYLPIERLTVRRDGSVHLRSAIGWNSFHESAGNNR